MKKALIITHVSGFLLKFETDNVRLLQELGYEVHYASNQFEKGYLYTDQQLKKTGVIFHHIDIAKSPYMFRMNGKALKQLIRIINEENIALIHCHTPVGGFLGRLAALLSGRLGQLRVIYTAHGFHFYKNAPLLNNTIYWCVERVMAHFTDVLIVINAEDYQNAQRFHLHRKGKVYLIPGIGIDFSVFQPVSEEKRMELRNKAGIKKTDFFILSVGELNENKNHKVMISAMKKIKEDVFPGYQNVYYGICGDGFFRNEIREFARKAGVLDSVRFFGYKCNIRDYYAIADVTVFPSKREGLGMAGLESLAMGVPVIAADNRGTREYMQDGKNGFVFRYDDIDGFAEGIHAVRSMPEDNLRRMKIYCRESVKRFDKKYTREIMRNIYGKLDKEVAGDG